MAVIEQITRTLLIIRKLNSQKGIYINLKDLTNYLTDAMESRGFHEGTSQATLQRDIKYIRYQLGINIVFDRSNKGYCIENENILLDIEQILEPFDILNALNADSGLSQIIIAEKYHTKGVEHLHKLIKAIRDTLKIKFNYSKFGQSDDSERYLEPYAIKQLTGKMVHYWKTDERKRLENFWFG